MLVVVGAAAVDVVASRERFLGGTSNPADIRCEAGGVGCRIWRRLPVPKLLLSAVGEDPAGRWLEERIRLEVLQGSGRSGLGAEAVLLRLPRHPTACYCAFMQAGRLLYGAADMKVIEQGLTWPRLGPRLPALGRGDLLVLEANLAPALVGRLLHRFGKRTRVVFEGVSVEKLLRHEAGLRDLYLLSVNEEEARALAGRVAPHARGSGWLAPFLWERRIEHLLVPRGRRGARLYACTPGGRLRAASFVPERVVRTRDSTGAGDRLLAALLSRLAHEGRAPAAETRRMGPTGRAAQASKAERTAEVERALPWAMREVEKALEEGRL
jgi:sugar/nucleoside kinase (ribokinase family)